MKITSAGILPADHRRARVLIHPRVYGMDPAVAEAGGMVHAFDVHPVPKTTEPTMIFDYQIIPANPSGLSLVHPYPDYRPASERVVVESVEQARALMEALT